MGGDTGVLIYHILKISASIYDILKNIGPIYCILKKLPIYHILKFVS
mgnify:CR=1 FL=1